MINFRSIIEIYRFKTELGYENFSIIESKIHSFEWLYLASKGHRRAKIDLADRGKFVVKWLTP